MALLDRVALRRVATWVALGVGGIALVATTPFFLDWVAPAHLNWGRLSDVSQTYGGLSILISAAALVGVVVSISHQARQVRIEHQELQRTAHRELILWSLSNPEFLTCWGPVNIPITQQRYKKIVYVNLIMGFWLTDFRLQRVSDKATLVNLRDHFRGEIARAHWSESKGKWRAFSEAQKGDVAGLRFVDLADQAYNEAVVAGPPVMEDDYFTYLDR
ncbi:DUF6082 family protein [Streptomyces sp. NPDC093970]|uniref:DUF6082 family protein n=1 Tax=Streptomyces sp. NPDC093970 TaxID=3155076 RepID=UPI00343B7B35